MMCNSLARLGISLVVLVGLMLAGSPAALAQADDAALGEAVNAIEQLDAMRSSLAKTLEGSTAEPSLDTFKQVCKPVGLRARQLSQDRGWQVKQVAQKYRNPAHAPQDLPERMALAKFKQDSELMGFWEHETHNDTPGRRYYRRITVEASCLACHGAKEQRPQFVKDRYPQDLAYDFRVGDLRGMYAVFIPDHIKQSLAAALPD